MTEPSPRPSARGRGSRRRAIVAFVVIGVLAVTASVVSVLRAARSAVTQAATAGAPPAATALPQEPYVLFRSTALDAAHGRVAVRTLANPGDLPLLTDLSCERVHMAGEVGICLGADRGLITTYHAYLFDRTLRVRHTVALPGIPSRARVSPDGSRAALTVFVSGHSYAQVGFSTQTFLLDVATGQIIGELGQFTVVRDGRRFSSVDFNFWGVTFTADARRFYATLGTRGQTFLVEGDVAANTMTVVRENVECPSLSPDGTRLVYKRRAEGGGSVRWRLHLLHLVNGIDRPLAEERSVDDQVEWLDDRRVVYGLPAEVTAATAITHLWSIDVDSDAAPHRFLTEAWSPTVVRQADAGPA